MGEQPRIKIIPGYHIDPRFEAKIGSLAVQVGTWGNGICAIADPTTNDELGEGGKIQIYSTTGYIEEDGGQAFPWWKYLGHVSNGIFIPKGG